MRNYHILAIHVVLLLTLSRLYVIMSVAHVNSVAQSPQCENDSVNGCKGKREQSRHRQHITQLYCANVCRLA